MSLITSKEVTPVVNFVVSTYGRLRFTQKTLPNLYGTASDTIPFMITVVDDKSTDGTRDYLMELFDDKQISTLILLDENMGTAKSQNIGWKLFDDVLHYIKIDNDVLFHQRHWLNDILYVLDNAPEIGVLGYNCEQVQYRLYYNGVVDYVVKDAMNIGGACIAIPRRTHERLGFWCEDYSKYGEDDADYGRRVSLSGLLNAYMPDNIMVHLPSFPENDEMVHFREYHLSKEKQRQKNVTGLFPIYMQEYILGVRSLKVDTSILETATYQVFSHVMR